MFRILLFFGDGRVLVCVHRRVPLCYQVLLLLLFVAKMYVLFLILPKYQVKAWGILLMCNVVFYLQ